MKLSIIVPVRNEEENIFGIIKKIEEEVLIEHELIVVDDYSLDNTAKLVMGFKDKYKNIKLVENKFKRGFGNAMRTGFMNASFDLVIPVMGDLCDDLGTIEKMCSKICQGYDVVCGSRYINGGKRLGGSMFKAFLSCWGGRSLHFILGIPTHDIANAFKMYRRNVLEAIDVTSEWLEISMEITLKAYFLGFKITEVPTIWKERSKGKSSFRVSKLLPCYLKLYLWAFICKLKMNAW